MVSKIIGSNFPTESPDELMPAPGGREIGPSHVAGYGKNQFGGASSLTPNDAPSKGQSGFLPGCGTPVNDQLRKLKADPYPTTFGNKNPNKK